MQTHRLDRHYNTHGMHVRGCNYGLDRLMECAPTAYVFYICTHTHFLLSGDPHDERRELPTHRGWPACECTILLTTWQGHVSSDRARSRAAYACSAHAGQPLLQHAVACTRCATAHQANAHLGRGGLWSAGAACRFGEPSGWGARASPLRPRNYKPKGCEAADKPDRRSTAQTRAINVDRVHVSFET